jgi:hypothetical protein
MIRLAESATRAEPRIRRRFSAVDWALLVVAPVAFLVGLVSYLFPEQSGPIAYEVACAAPPKHQGYLDNPHWMLVKIFDPATGQWSEKRKDEAIPGQEFVAMKMLFKQEALGTLSNIHGEVDVSRLEDAYRAFDVKNYRLPKPDDVVYVFGQHLPRTGFNRLAYVGPGEAFRFQGRIYKTEPGNRPDTLRVIDTGETLSKAGGEPNPKPIDPIVLSLASQAPPAREEKSNGNGD